MNNSAYYSVVLDQSAQEVWDTVRDFNSYPIWVNGVEDSHIENDLSGTAVGSVRNFAIGGARTRQRLVAHSDVDRFFSYESCAPLKIDDESGVTRSLVQYQGTLQLTPVVEVTAVSRNGPPSTDAHLRMTRTGPIGGRNRCRRG